MENTEFDFEKFQSGAIAKLRSGAPYNRQRRCDDTATKNVFRKSIRGGIVSSFADRSKADSESSQWKK